MRAGIILKQIAGIALACVLLSACNESDEQVQRQVQITLQSPEPLASSALDLRSLNLSDSLPRDSSRSELQARSYNPDRLQLTVRLNGITASTQRIEGSDAYEVSGTFSGDALRIDISWSELFQQTILQLATYSGQFSIQSEINISGTDYNMSLFDDDKDGDSNITERFALTDPFNSNECSTCRDDVDTHIVPIGTALAPRIDGSYDSSWDQAQFKDLQGDLNIINSVDIGPQFGNAFSFYPPRGVPPFRWAGMHDGEYLYLLILGNAGSTQTAIRDSSSIVEDDSAFISIDTATGKQGYQIPLVALNGNSNTGEVAVNGGDEPGSGATGVGQTTEAGLLIAACTCTGDQSLWEVRIPLDTSNTEIEVDVPFKMVVGIVDDVDGDAADFYFRWPQASAEFDGAVVLK